MAMSFPLRFLTAALLACVFAITCTAQDPREQAWSVLKDGLNNGNIEKRSRAVADLGLLPDDPQALDAGLTDDSAALAAAALTLANDPDPRSGEALAQAALNQKKWLVRAAAFNAIAKRGDPSQIHTAVLGLQDEQDEVQYAAAAAVIRL